MLKDHDFSHLEFVSATKNISVYGDMKLVLTTITFLDKKDSVAHLEGIDLALAKNSLEQDGKYIKLCASYITFEGAICKDEVMKVIFNEVNNKYRVVSRSEDSDELKTVLEDIQYIESIFERSTDKFVYM